MSERSRSESSDESPSKANTESNMRAGRLQLFIEDEAGLDSGLRLDSESSISQLGASVENMSLDSAGAMNPLPESCKGKEFDSLVEGLSPISATSYPPRTPLAVKGTAGEENPDLDPTRRESVPSSAELDVANPPQESLDESAMMYQMTEGLFDSPVLPQDPSEPASAEAPEVEGSIRSAPSKLKIFVSDDGMRVALSEMGLAIREAASLGSFMPACVGNYVAAWLFDTGASLSQASPELIKAMLPYLTEVAQDEVEFISVESKSKLSMRLFKCEVFSLVQVEARRKSKPCITYVVENPKVHTFPLLLGLQTMCDLDLSATFRAGVVMDPEGSPYRLYNKAALPKLRESLKIMTQEAEREIR